MTLRCLESLRELTERPDCEIILVDNGSADGTSEAVAGRFPQVQVITLTENLGVSRGRNCGLRRARGRLLMILDNDTIAEPATLLAMADYMDSHPDCGLLAPRLVSPRGRTQASFKPFPGLGIKIRNFLNKKAETSYAAEVPAGEVEPFYVIGAAQMFPAGIFESIGGLDEKIFFGPEDADFCMAVRAAGKRVVYNPAFTIIHEWQRATTSRPFSRATRRHIAALLHFYVKHRRLF